MSHIITYPCPNLENGWVNIQFYMDALHWRHVMTIIASQITSLTIVYSIVYSDADQSKHQSSASLAFVWGIHRGPVNSPHKWPVTRKMFPFDDVIMAITYPCCHPCAALYNLCYKRGRWYSVMIIGAARNPAFSIPVMDMRLMLRHIWRYHVNTLTPGGYGSNLKM